MNAPAESKLYLNLCQEIVKLRSAFITKHKDNSMIPQAEIEKRAKENKPLLDTQKLQIERNLLNEFMVELLPFLKEREVFAPEEIEKFLGLKENLNLSELIHMILIGDLSSLKSLSAQNKIGADLLTFIGLNLSQALLELYADKLKSKVDQENWLKGNCPVCGSLPSIEKLRREDGKRIMHCGLCGTEWQFKRIMCPYCGNEDQNSLRFFLAEKDSSSNKSPFRVDVCDRCRKYIKTLDERQLPIIEKPDLHIENLNTLYLDLLAQKDCYQSPTYWMIAPSKETLI